MVEKQEIRQVMMQKRAELTSDENLDLAQTLKAYINETPHIFKDKTIALFSPIRNEINVTQLYEDLEPLASAVALPCITPLQEMVFNLWDGLHYIPDAMKIPTGKGEEVIPDVIFVPFLAFNRQGHRLGYGRGFYDKTLALLPSVRSIGVGFSWQENQDFPFEHHDIPLNEIWTEKERIYASKNK